MSYVSKIEEAEKFENAGQSNMAAEIYRQILAENPNIPDLWHRLGILFYTAGNLQQAFEMFANAVRLNPNNFIYHRNLGEIARRLGVLEQAVLSGNAACKLAPKDVDAHYNLGLAYTDAADLTKAIQFYKRAIKIDKNHGLSWNNLGSILERQGDKKGALKAYEKAVAVNVSHAEAQNNAGAIYVERGMIDEAKASFSAAINARPDFIEAHYNLSSLKTYTVNDPQLAMLEGLYVRREELTPSSRVRYGFALGKALEDVGQYDRAFAAYDEGNRIQHALLPDDEARANQLLEEIINTFTVDFFSQRAGWKGARPHGKTPIFIIGMPRSGTTLIEQILATHGSIFGAGELTDLGETINQKIKIDVNGSFPSSVVSLTKEQVKKIGDVYIERVWKMSPESKYITDKMPANFFYLGLIHLALPNAKIIHAVRDPMDSCFSCFARLFNDTMEFAYDLGSLGRYYRRYMTLMRHWESVLPEGSFLNLSYEDMVSDVEGQARRLLKFIGLPWDERCLEFYKNDRLVKTASVAQVRKPIYKTSVARWKNFAQHLRPLLDLVQEFRDANDELDLESLPSIPRLRSEIPPGLVEQCLGLQGKGDHLAVIALLASHLPNCGIDSTAAILYHLNGISLYRLNRFNEARESYERSLHIQPNHPTCYNSLGFLLQDMGLMQEAHAAFEKAIDQSPDMAMARLNLGMAQLKLGDFVNGWENYEARWTGSAESVQGVFNRPNCPLPSWDGRDDVADKSLLVITEQGFGDTFQFVRYLDKLSSIFKKVGFVCSEPTRRLMEWAYADKVVLFTHMPLDYSAWDYHSSLMSLPRLCKTRVNTIPAAVPYLKTPKPAAEHWGERLERLAPKCYRIGIAWAGRKAHQYDARRSLSFSQIRPLLDVPNISWVSLQKWASDEIRPEVPKGINWIDWTEELHDFGDTAALIENLDLVISIDSAMVHLAGGLGKPVWMMNRFDCEWRWFQSLKYSPWYPRMRIFNQERFGDWRSVVAEVASNLLALSKTSLSEKTTALQNFLPSSDALRIPDLEFPSSISGHASDSVSMTIERALGLAGQHQVAGRLPEAEVILRQILKSNPQNAHALHLLGVVTYQAGQPILAFDLIRQAISIEPQAALFYSNLGEMYRQQGRIDEAIDFGRKAIGLDPTMASAHSNLGIAFFDARKYRESELSHRNALAITPNILHSLNNLGSIERALGNKSEALAWYRKALEVNPDYLEALTNIGAVLMEDDRPEEAMQPLLKVLNFYPESPEALCNLGLAYFKLDDFEKAEALLRRSLCSRSDYPEALIGLSQVLFQVERLNESESLLKEVLKRAPDRSDAWSQLGAIYTEQGNDGLANAAYDKAISINEDNTDALIGLANLKLESGKIKEAILDLKLALEIDPNNLGARFHLTQAQRVEEGDENLRALEIKAAGTEIMRPEKRISLHYALGKSYDDLREFDKAFHHFSEGARIKRASLNYSADADQERAQKVIEAFSKDRFAALSGGGDPDKSPIFIVGMPRSGTTLTEQIIASHPMVYGAGELHDLFEIIQEPFADGTSIPYPDNISKVSRDMVALWGGEYIRRLKMRNDNAARITDKMPANYMALGLIPLMLPNAKIIHVIRNPIDTCLSCFTHLFNRHQDPTYDLVELGRHYMNYVNVTNHWRSILPTGSFLEVRYEDIISDIDAQARRLIDYVDLPWDDSCLDFYKAERKVRTASVTQVRQPIYQTSVDRWRSYEKYLGPLLEQLKPII